MKFQATIEADYEVEDISDMDQAALEYQDLTYEIREAFPSNAKIKIDLRFKDEQGNWNIWSRGVL